MCPQKVHGSTQMKLASILATAFIAAGVLAAHPASVSAMPLSASVHIQSANSCSDLDQTNVPASAECSYVTSTGSISAHGKAGTDLGIMGVSADLTMVGSPTQPAGGFIRVTAASQWAELVSFNVLTGTFRLPIEVQGSFSTAGPIFGRTIINVSAGGTSIYLRDENAGFANGFPNQSIGSLGTTTVDIPIQNGVAFINLSINGRAVCDVAFVTSPICDVHIDFLDGVRLLGATVLDDQGNLVANPVLNSPSGFDYLTGVAPSSVPLPGGLALTASTLAVAYFLRRRA